MEQHSLESFNETKALNAILFVANKLKRKDFHKIFKILYFADRNHLSEYGRSITGDRYIAMNDGPVPSKIYDIFKSVRGDSYLKDNGHFSKLFTVEKWDLVHPIEEANTKALSKTDLIFLENSLSEYGDMTWNEIREKSHDYAWRNTVLNSQISLENLVIETGNEESYIEYLKEQMLVAKSF